MSSIPRLRAWRLAFAGPLAFSYFALFYLILLQGGSIDPLRVLLLVAAMIFYFANGFLINDLADRKNDQAAGVRSRERGHDLSETQMLLIVILTAVIGILIFVYLGGDIVFRALWIVSFILSFSYSSPPVALKRRGLPGAICDSLIERPLPILMIFSFFQHYSIETLLFPLLSELSWSIFKHQVADIELDTKSGVKTFAVLLGRGKSYKVLNYFLNPFSVLSHYLLMSIVAIEVPSTRVALIVVGIIMAIGIGATIALRDRLRTQATPTDPPYIMFANFAYRILILPVLAAFVIMLQPQLVILGVLLVVSLIPHLMYYRNLLPVLAAEAGIAR